MENKTKEAVEILIKALKESPGYYYGWQTNIAMAFKDEFWRTCTTHQHLDLMDEDSLHTIANIAADNFLKQLINGQ